MIQHLRLKIIINNKIIIITDDLKKAFLIKKDIQDENKDCWIMVYKWSTDDLVEHPDIFDQTKSIACITDLTVS